MIKEIIRKLIHILGYFNIIVFVVVSEFIGPKAAFLSLTLILLIFLELEYLRVEHKVLPIPNNFNIFREKEQVSFGGHIYMTIAAIICFAAFNQIIAETAFSMMILGDAFSAVIGKKWGTYKFIFSNKTLEGTLAGFLGNIIGGYFFINNIPNFFMILIPMAVVASLTEVFTQKLDDNLTVAIFAGVCGQVLFLLI